MNSTDTAGDSGEPEVDRQRHIDFRGSALAVEAVSLGPDGSDYGLTLRSGEQWVTIVLDDAQEQDLAVEILAEHGNRAKIRERAAR